MDNQIKKPNKKMLCGTGQHPMHTHVQVFRIHVLMCVPFVSWLPIPSEAYTLK